MGVKRNLHSTHQPGPLLPWGCGANTVTPVPSFPCLPFGSTTALVPRSRSSQSTVPASTVLPTGPVLRALGVGKACKLVLGEKYISQARILSLWHSHSYQILQIIQGLQKVKPLTRGRIPQTLYLSFGSSSGKKQSLRDYQSDSLCAWFIIL